MKKSIPRRSYNQKVRAETAAETRRRIIEVTRGLLTRAPLESVSLPAIATEADVARSTVYAIFGSREGLMVAVAEDLLDRGGFARIGEALRGPDVVQAVETSMDVAMELYSQEHEVGWALLSLAAVDRDVRRVLGALGPWDSGRRYLNFAESAMDPRSIYPEESYERFLQAKARYDPTGLFRANHPVTP